VRALQWELRSVLRNVQLDLPEAVSLTEVEWGPATYGSEGLQRQTDAARAAIDEATASLANSLTGRAFGRAGRGMVRFRPERSPHGA